MHATAKLTILSGLSLQEELILFTIFSATRFLEKQGGIDVGLCVGFYKCRDKCLQFLYETSFCVEKYQQNDRMKI
jgi:hypothetical protein